MDPVGWNTVTRNVRSIIIMPAVDYIQSLIGYVEDIKPYHTKIFGVGIEYQTEIDINVTIGDQLMIEIGIGTHIWDIEETGQQYPPYAELALAGLTVPRDRIGTQVVVGGLAYNLPTGIMDVISISIGEELLLDGGLLVTDPGTPLMVAASTIRECLIIMDGVGFDGESNGFDSYDMDNAVDIRRYDDFCSDQMWDFNSWDQHLWDQSAPPSFGTIVVGDTTLPIPNPDMYAYVHTQSVSSITWTIDHNLNQYPSQIRVFDGGGTQIEYATIFHLNRGELIITFDNAVQGTAQLIPGT